MNRQWVSGVASVIRANRSPEHLDLQSLDESEVRFVRRPNKHAETERTRRGRDVVLET